MKRNKIGKTDPTILDEKISRIHRSKHVTQKGYTSKNT